MGSPSAASCRSRCSLRVGTPTPSPTFSACEPSGHSFLCEQVVGRALRRQSYDLNDEGLFDVEYADVLGVPFDFTAKTGCRETCAASPDSPGQSRPA